MDKWGFDAVHMQEAAERAANAMRELGEAIAVAEAEAPIVPQYKRSSTMKFYVEHTPEPWQGKGKRKKGRIK